MTATRERDLRRALWLSAFSMVWNGIAGSLAAYVALVSGSLSLLGFGVDAVIDSIASVALIWRFRVESAQPARAARVERMAERLVGISLILLAVYLVGGSIRALATQSHPDMSFASVALLLASVTVLPPLARAKYLVAKRLGSGALRLDSILTAVAALLAAISLASLAASDRLGLWWADAVAAIVVAVILAREGLASMGAAEPEGDAPVERYLPTPSPSPRATQYRDRDRSAPEDHMPERSNEDIVRRYWQAHAAHDHKTVSELRHPDWLAEWPQSRERVRGDANDRSIMDNYPGGEPHLDATHRIVGAEDRWVVTPAYTVQRVVGNGDAWWGSGIGKYPDGRTWHFVAMVELRDGKIYRETAYFAEPFDPPAWRAAWVERMD